MHIARTELIFKRNILFLLCFLAVCLLYSQFSTLTFLTIDVNQHTTKYRGYNILPFLGLISNETSSGSSQSQLDDSDDDNSYYQNQTIDLTEEIDDNDSKTYVTDPYPDQPWPRIALLMSFPNSGTSYSLSVTESFSGYAVGTNYVKELPSSWLVSRHVPHSDAQIYSDSPMGPYWLPGGQRHSSDMKSYILTKTHCGGYCNKCDPRMYRTSLKNFGLFCRNSRKAQLEPYEESKVSRVVRLIRDPLDNIVSRFHHERSKMSAVEKKNQYPDSRKGFHLFCQQTVDRYTDGEDELLPAHVVAAFQRIPCHADFFRYVQWHNLANRWIRQQKYPRINIYYDDYESTDNKWNTTMKKLMTFLNIQEETRNATNSIHPFQSGKTYHNYYFNKEKCKIWRLIQKVSTNETWTLLQRYYVNTSCVNTTLQLM